MTTINVMNIRRLCFFFLLLISHTLSSQEILQAEYYFNNDPGEGNGSPITISSGNDISDQIVLINTNPLSIGTHTLNLRTKDENGSWSHTHQQNILMSPLPSSDDIVAVEYYCNNDPGKGNGIEIPITPSADIDNLSASVTVDNLGDGIHHLYVRALQHNGQWSHSSSFTIYNKKATPNNKITKIEYYWDDDPGFGQGIDITATTASEISNQNITIPTSTLNTGLHTLSIRSRDEEGVWSITNIKDIIVLADNTIKDITSIEYYWDDDPGYGQGTTISATAATNISNISTTISTSGLSDGIHTLAVRAKSSDHVWSHTESKAILYRVGIFTKDIVDVEYYWNADPGEGNATKATIPTPSTANVQNLGIAIDLSQITNGVNYLRIRTKDESGKWSLTNSEVIYVYQNPKAEIVNAEYYWNIDPGYGEGTSFSVDTLMDITNQAIVLNMDELAYGIHKLHVRYQTAQGKWTQDEIIRIRYKDGEVYTLAEGEYFIDQDPGLENGTPFTYTSSTDAEDLNVLIFANNIDPGPHSLYVRTKNAIGQWSHTNAKIDISFETILPLNFLSFDVFKRKQSAQLRWKVNNAVNTSHFEVMKKSDNTFQAIGQLATDNLLTSKTYGYIDKDVTNGWNYYQIKQVDIDGAFTVSNVKSVYFSSLLEVAVFPNPTMNTISVNNIEGDNSYSLFDNSYKLILEGKIDNSSIIDVSHLTEGNYHLLIYDQLGHKEQFMIVKI